MEYFFKTHYSLKSILTLESPEEDIGDNKPVSVALIAKKHNLPYVFLVEDDIGGFFEAYQSFEEVCPFYFGWRVTMCENIDEKTKESFDTEHKIVIFAKNTEGYYDLIKLYNKAQTDGFYYVPRLDSKLLKELWTNNLMLVVPFFDSHVYNSYSMSRSILPDFGKIKPIYSIENHPLPFLDKIREKVEKLCSDFGYSILECRTVYYYKPEDFEAYQTYRCIQNRTSLEVPNLDGMAANSFSFL